MKSLTAPGPNGPAKQADPTVRRKDYDMLDTCAVDQSEEPEATRPYLRAIGSGPGIDLDARQPSGRGPAHRPRSGPQLRAPGRYPPTSGRRLRRAPHPYAVQSPTFPNGEGYDELVLARAIPFQSLCQHHLLPFHGVAHVGYLPGDRILGLSKLARVVHLFAQGLQVQERLTKQVADWLQKHVQPKGVGVVIEAEHLCMSLRGVKASGSRTMTSALHGLLRDDARSRQKFFALTGVNR